MARTILVIGEDLDDARLTAYALKKNVSNEVIVVQNGNEAMNHLFGPDHPIRPTFIVLDLKMPRANGLDILYEIRSHEDTRAIPVVIFTMSDERQDIIESYRLGANSYIYKPVTYCEFTNVVRQVEEYWLQLNQLPQKA